MIAIAGELHPPSSRPCRASGRPFTRTLEPTTARWAAPVELFDGVLKQGRKQMASDIHFVQFIVDQMGKPESIRYRKMFGEYAIYCHDKVVALVCDNQLFVKQTKAGRSFMGNVVEAPAYPGAKPSFLIEDQIEDKEWLRELIALTEQELPLPRPKEKRKKR